MAYEKQTWVDGTSIANAERLNHIEDGIYQNSVDITKFGKLLWAGEFTTGSLTVPELSNYKALVVVVAGVACFGNQFFGGGLYLKYTTSTIGDIGYRFDWDVNTSTISTSEGSKGAYDSDGNNLSITAIYGLF